MAVVPMQKLSICAHKTNRKAVLETLQQFGGMEIIPDAIDDPELEKMNTADARAQFERDADLADQAIEILNRYAPEKNAGIALLRGNEAVSAQTVKDVALKRGSASAGRKRFFPTRNPLMTAGEISLRTRTRKRHSCRG